MKSLKKLMNLNGRVALITGGAGHLGSVIADGLAEMGAHIVLVDCQEKTTHQKAELIAAQHKVDVLPIIVDLAEENKVKEIPQKVLNQFGRYDILITCAALVGTSQLTGWAVPFEEQSIDTWRKALEINLTSVFILTQASTNFLRQSGHGSIINIGSIYGMVGPDWRLYKGTTLGNPAAYNASKGGILQLTRWLATTLAPDVRANTISIGGVYRGHVDPFLTRFIERTPLKRMATEEDIKGAAFYLASDLSNYVTGHNLVVDGGWTVW